MSELLLRLVWLVVGADEYPVFMRALKIDDLFRVQDSPSDEKSGLWRAKSMPYRISLDGGVPTTQELNEGRYTWAINAEPVVTPRTIRERIRERA